VNHLFIFRGTNSAKYSNIETTGPQLSSRLSVKAVQKKSVSVHCFISFELSCCVHL